MTQPEPAAQPSFSACKVYRHKSMAPDIYLGRVSADGRVYQAHLGPDRLAGRVDLDTGRIYESRFGPDRHIGRVALDSGKVYRARLGLDEYLGRVDSDGRFHQHKALAPDVYVGKAVPAVSLAHAGAAFLLLCLPHLESETE